MDHYELATKVLGCTRGAVAISAFFFAIGCLSAPSRPGAGHELSLQPNGEVLGQGANEFGQVWYGRGDLVAQPQRLPLTGIKPVGVAAGGRHSLAVDDTGNVWAWGDNSSGQLGVGHTKPVKGVSKVLGLTAKAVQVVAGVQHSAALLADGSIWVWGANNRGQLGHADADAFAVATRPTKVAGLGHALVLGAGNDSVVTLIDRRGKKGVVTKTVWGWGAGNGLPHLFNSVQTELAMRANPALRSGSPQTVLVVRRNEVAAVQTGSPAPVVVAPTPIVAAAPTPSPLGLPASATANVTTVAVSAPVAVAAVPTTSPASAAIATVSVSGTVRLADAPMDRVQMTAVGATCSDTDKQGRYVCTVTVGWSGRLSLKRNNYRFSPSALTFQNLSSDAWQQDFAAIYDPR